MTYATARLGEPIFFDDTLVGRWAKNMDFKGDCLTVALPSHVGETQFHSTSQARGDIIKTVYVYRIFNRGGFSVWSIDATDREEAEAAVIHCNLFAKSYEEPRTEPEKIVAACDTLKPFFLGPHETHILEYIRKMHERMVVEAAA